CLLPFRFRDFMSRNVPGCLSCANRYVSRKWGRIGTSSGGHKLEEFPSSRAACEQFKALFLDKTGNDWEAHRRGAFEKKPGKFFPVEVDYGTCSRDDVASLGLSVIGGRSRLNVRLQELIRVIFDVKEMQRVMQHDLEIDVRKMPLGK